MFGTVEAQAERTSPVKAFPKGTNTQVDSRIREIVIQSIAFFIDISSLLCAI
jgi:hypothetical protein